MIAALAACGNKTIATGTTETSPASATASENQTKAEKQAKTDINAKASDSIDVDLTQMSSTMIYSEVQNMMMTPEDYEGKTVKATGTFSVAKVGDNRYFACVIKDATACCSQGLEFKWAGNHSYPADYPEQGADITVTGEFSTYMEGTQKYCELKNAALEF